MASEMQLPAPSCASSSPPVWTYDQQRAIKMQMKYIIVKNLRFNSFDNERWTKLVQTCLQPLYERVSTSTMKRLAFNYYIKAKKDLIKYFESFQGKVSLTIHAWNTPFGCKYLCFTCHWIDSDTWKMSKRAIGCGPYASPHAEDIHGDLMTFVSEFKIKDKILSISFDDNASYYTSLIEMMKKEVNPKFDGILFLTKCASHILSSMVQSCLDFVAPVVKKFINMFYQIRHSKRDGFVEFLKAKNAKYKETSLCWLEKWDTVYKTFSLFVKQKPLLVEFFDTCINEDIDEDINEDIDEDTDGDENGISFDMDVTSNDWVIMESLLGILEVFYNSTIRLSNAKNSTIPLLLGEILLISNMFKQQKQDPFWQSLVLEMQTKFLKYYETIPPIYSIATALNPTIGVGGVENILEDIAKNLGLHMDNMNDNDFAKVSVTKFNSTLQEVFNECHKMYKSGASEELAPITTSRNIILQSITRKKSESALISSELELYKKTDFSKIMTSDEYENINILEWWKIKGRFQYPILGAIALDLLTVQASVESLEHVFYLNGRELSEYMSNLTPWWLQRRVFMKEHFEAIDSEENDDFGENFFGEIEFHGDDDILTYNDCED